MPAAGRRGLALAPAALVALAIIGVSACGAPPAGGTQTYRAHGVSLDYPAGWLEGSPGRYRGQRAAMGAFGPGPSAWMDMAPRRTGLTSPHYRREHRRDHPVCGAGGPALVHDAGRSRADHDRRNVGPEVPGRNDRTRSPTKITLVIAFNGTTQYEIACGHMQATARAVTRACAQAIRTFKVRKAG